MDRPRTPPPVGEGRDGPPAPGAPGTPPLSGRLNRRAPLRSDPEKVRAWSRRSRRPLPKESSKRKAERRARAKVRSDALDASTGCRARGLPGVGPCSGPLEVDEIVSRARRPGGHLDPLNVQVLCRGHNGWKEDHPDEAEALGLARRSWDP